MERRELLKGLMLLTPAGLLGAQQAAGQPGGFDRVPDPPRDRDREGGRPIPPGRGRGGRGGEQEATEDGLPQSESPSLDGRGRTYIMPRWRLGVHAYNTETGVVVTRVAPYSPAARVGLEPGDRIVAVSGYQVGYVDDRLYYLGEELWRRADPRGRVLLLAQNVRNQRLLTLDVQLEGGRSRAPDVSYRRR